MYRKAPAVSQGVLISQIKEIQNFKIQNLIQEIQKILNILKIKRLIK